MFPVQLKKSKTEHGRYIKTPNGDVEKVGNAFALFFFEDRDMKGKSVRKTEIQFALHNY